jgi:long-chain acyl-CoA synthetase
MSVSFGYFFDEALQEDAAAIAVIDLHGGREQRRSYGELDRRATQLANALLASGLVQGARVLLTMPARVEFLEAWLGCMRGGFVPVLVNPQATAAALRHIIQDSAAAGVIGQPADIPVLAAECSHLRQRVTVGGAFADWSDYERLLSAQNTQRAPVTIDADGWSTILYTSGSSGLPKGVPLTHRGQLWWVNTVNSLYPGRKDQRSLVAVPLFHKNAMAGAVKTRLRSGGSLVLMPKFVPALFLQALARYECTHASGVPTMYAALLRETRLLQDLRFPRLELLTVGSAPVHEELITRAAEAFAVPMSQGYGLTEGGPTCIGPPLDGRSVPLGSVGVPWPGVQTKLVAEDGSESDSLGELWLRNPGVISGYLNLPAVNAERFVEGWLRTGDLFFRDREGFLFFRGRVDEMFVCGGENIYPKEVENLLMQHPEVLQACVVSLEHETKGQAPVAMVVLKSAASADEAALKRFCLEHGPAFAHPRRIAIVDQLPLHGPGKVDARKVQGELGHRFGRLRTQPRSV